jgi:membrane protease YdiL (CAAX protease family)
VAALAAREPVVNLLLKPLLEALRGGNRKPAFILLLAPVIVTTYRCLGDRPFYRAHLAARFVLFGDAELTAALYSFAACFVLLGLVPAVLLRVLFGEPLSAYGVQAGDLRFGGKAFLVMAPVLVAASAMAARMPSFRAEYPLFKGACATLPLFAGYACAYLVYYLGWEFFFRGFLQHGLRQSLGDGNAILVQTLASCLAHLGKPGGEIYGAILAGVVWGLVVFRSRSLLAVLLAHWLLGVSLDTLICCGGLPCR